jgi:LEA14-like dessication related protein
MKYTTSIKKFSFIALLVLVLSSCLEYKEVEVVKIVDVGVKDISTKGVDVEVAMQIKNPNKYNISIVDSDLNLFLKGQKMGTANIKEKVTLKKKSNEVYRFTIQSDLKDIASGGLSVMMGLITQSSMELKVQGDIKAKAKGISKSIPIDITEKIKL